MWDHEADVVIVGYGGAGASAALTAIDAGAKVLVLEKNPEGGGNTKYSGGSMREYLDVEKASDYIESLCDGTTERDVIETFVREASLNTEWMKGMGAEIAPRGLPKRFPISAPVAYPTTRGAEGIGSRLRIKGATESGGIDLWGVLARKAAEKKVNVLCSTPAKQLLIEEVALPLTGHVLETVWAFLETGSIEGAARQLFIHTNTVRYRLRKATELSGVVVTSPRGTHTLRIALSLATLTDNSAKETS